MKHARLLCTPIVLALLCAVPRVAADIGDNPGVPVTVKSPNESPNSCCNDWFGWGPFRIGDPQTWYWGWRYCVSGLFSGLTLDQPLFFIVYTRIRS